MSEYPNIPIHDPNPDAAAFIDYLLGRRTTHTHAPMVEYLVDDLLRKHIGTEMLGHTWTDGSDGRADRERWFANFIDFWYRMGYDYVRYEQGVSLPRPSLSTADTAPGAERNRSWVDEHSGAIANWDDFERYPWPKIEQFDFSAFEHIDTHLPDGLGFIVSHGGGIFENVSQLLSLEVTSYLLYDDPKLVKAVTDKIGGLIAEFYEQVHSFGSIVAVLQGDDMGHKTGTMIKPDHLRDYFLPWHKRFAEIAHRHNRPYFLHSCGNMIAIMPDLIDDVRIDGKHSFEDIILPIEDFLGIYGDRIAALGGMDIDTLARAPVADVRKRTRQIMDRCGKIGRFAMGSGSSVASYIPVENYLAMLDEAQAWRFE